LRPKLVIPPKNQGVNVGVVYMTRTSLKKERPEHQWLMPVILASLEAEIKSISVQDQLVCDIHLQKK
jgi:hypothetical protein